MLVSRWRNRATRPFENRVVGAACALAAAMWGAPLFGQIQAAVNVNTNQVLSTMSPLGIGLHTSPYYNNMSHANVPSRLEEAGVTTLRFGGGGYADVFHWSIGRASWENGITGGGLSPWWGEPGNFGYVGAGSDFASFVRLLDNVDNSHAVVTVNYGSAMKLVNGQSAVPDFGGQPKEAAAWVAYANADASIYGTPNDIVIGLDEQGNDWKTAGYWARLRASTPAQYQSWAQADGVHDPLNAFLAINRAEPVGIKYWEIGNETFGTGYYGGGNGYSVDYDLAYGTNRSGHPNLSPERYGQDVVEYSQLMKSIDPTIKIGAVLSTPPDDWSWDYWPKGGGANNPNNKHWNPEVLAQAAGDIDFVMVHWYPWPGPATPANFGDTLVNFPQNVIPAMIDGSGTHTGASAGLRDWLADFGIPDAEIMITEFRYFDPQNIQSSHRAAADALFVADSYATWFEHGVTSVQYLEMLTKDFLTDSGGLTRGSAFYGISMIDRFVQPGDSLVSADSSNNSVRAHAAVQDDGSIAIMILNLHRTDSADVEIDIEGVLLDSDGTQFTLLNGTNMSQAAASGLGNSFDVSVPARTIATYLIPALPHWPGDFNRDGIVDAADYVVWRDGLGTDYTLDHYDEWQTHFGETAGGGGSVAAAAVPEPAARVMALAGILATMAGFRWDQQGRRC